MKAPIRLFSGSSHPALAEEIAKCLKIPVSELMISKFANGELYARPVQTVRGCDVFVVQTATENVNEDLMQLFIILDSLKRSFAGKIHVIMPNYAYARQDRVAYSRESISAKLVADLISTAGAEHLVGMHFHSSQTQGFFNFPVDNLSSQKLFVEYFRKKKIKDLVIVSPDAGGVKEARKFADLLSVPLVIIHKVRSKHNVAEATHVVGDVKGKVCLLVDDMIDTAGSLCAAVDALRANGAKKEMYVAATHPIFSDPAAERLRKLRLTEVVVTNSLPIPPKKRFPGLTVLSIASLLAQVIQNVNEAKSVSEVFE
ncbi:MAG: ribose-phosphate pyrophosphokinase [Patescibacteria group bacterium]